jgi:hypothetical protein
VTKDALTTPTSNQTTFDAPQRVARLPLVAVLVLISFSLIVGALGWRHCSKAAGLRRIAREIQPGESIVAADTRLGKSQLAAEYGWQYPGGPPTKFEAMYGGTMDDLRGDLDSLVLRVFRGYPRWYRPQNRPLLSRSWPVLVLYDGDKCVTAVIIDGVEITPAVRSEQNAEPELPIKLF